VHSSRDERRPVFMKPDRIKNWPLPERIVASGTAAHERKRLRHRPRRYAPIELTISSPLTISKWRRLFEHSVMPWRRHVTAMSRSKSLTVNRC